MNHSEKPAPAPARRSAIRPVLTVVALLLGLLALVVALQDLGSSAGAVDQPTALLNLATGLAGVLGAAGYWRGKKWGLYSYALSVLGHSVAHMALILSAIAHNRISPGSLFGPLVIPVIAVTILIGMARQSPPTRRGDVISR